MTSTRDGRILEDGAAIAQTPAAELVRLANDAVARNGRFAVALAGGSTPKALYALLVGDSALRNSVPWDKMHLFFGDERHVPPDHPDSNYKMAREAMLTKAPL